MYVVRKRGVVYTGEVNSAAISRVAADYFRSNPNVVAVYLFGSQARDTARADSDVDIGVLYAQTPRLSLVGASFADEAELSERLVREVQVVVMNGAPLDLVHRILRDGLLVLELDRSLRIAFEVRARNEYFDLLPILREYRGRAGA